MHSSAVKLTC